MGKPFLVKRGGKYLKVYRGRAPGGKVVNLQTTDAEEARKRARAITRGDYSWRGETADKVRRVLDGSPGGEPEPIEPDEDCQEVASSAPAAAGPESGPIPAAAGPPQPESPSAMPTSNADPVAAANEEAAATAASVADTLKSAAASVGIDLSELTKPENLGGLHIAGQSWLTQWIAKQTTGKGVPPLVVPSDLMPVVKSLGEAWQKQLAAWNITVVDVTPGWAILGCSAIFAIVQLAALAKEATPAQEGTAPAGAA